MRLREIPDLGRRYREVAKPQHGVQNGRRGAGELRACDAEELPQGVMLIATRHHSHGADPSLLIGAALGNALTFIERARSAGNNGFSLKTQQKA